MWVMWAMCRLLLLLYFYISHKLMETKSIRRLNIVFLHKMKKAEPEETLFILTFNMQQTSRALHYFDEDDDDDYRSRPSSSTQFLYFNSKENSLTKLNLLQRYYSCTYLNNQCQCFKEYINRKKQSNKYCLPAKPCSTHHPTSSFLKTNSISPIKLFLEYSRC